MNVFFLKTLLHLGLQVTLTALTANQMKNTKIKHKWLWFVVSLVLLFAMRFRDIPMMIRLIMFCIFSILNGFVFSSFLKYSKPEEIQSAIFYTVFTFAVMIVVGFMLLKYDFDITPLMVLISIYSISMIIIYLYMTLFDVQDKKTKMYVKLASIALFSLYIIFDTHNNFGKDYDNDIVISTLDYYTDVVGIFQNILSFFSNS